MAREESSPEEKAAQARRKHAEQQATEARERELARREMMAKATQEAEKGIPSPLVRSV